MTDQIALVERAMNLSGDVVAAVKPDQLDDPTPCTEWKVRDLLNHMVGVTQLFATAATGERSSVNPFGAPDDVIGDDPQAAFDSARAELLTAWRKRGVDGNVPLLQGEAPASVALTICITDQVQHGWDLARATGQDFEADDELLEVAEEFTQQNMKPEHRGPDKPFGVVVDPPAGASRTDRLAAFLGRHPE
jgi:uncharacterized protein (TIGR03086 family)